MERNKAIYLILTLASIQSVFGDDHPVNPVRQCSNNRTIMSVMKETFETVMIEVKRFRCYLECVLGLSYFYRAISPV